MSHVVRVAGPRRRPKGAAARKCASGGGGSGGSGRAAATATTAGNGGGTSKPLHKRCGTAMSRLYYTVYSRADRGSKVLPLRDWMWCQRCAVPIHMIQCDMPWPAGGTAQNGRPKK